MHTLINIRYFILNLKLNDMNVEKFESVKEMVNWLIDNEGKELADGYGRKWKYEKYSFYFKDIGAYDSYVESLKCLHLHKTHIVSI